MISYTSSPNTTNKNRVIAACQKPKLSLQTRNAKRVDVIENKPPDFLDSLLDVQFVIEVGIVQFYKINNKFKESHNAKPSLSTKQCKNSVFLFKNHDK